MSEILFANNHQWTIWETVESDFLKFFLSPRYIERVQDEIRKRPREPFKDCMLTMQNLMRHTGYSEAQTLKRIFRYSSSEYLWHVRRKDFDTLEDLLELARDLESIPPTPQTTREQHRMMAAQTATPLTYAAVLNPSDEWRQCNQNGHFGVRCRNDPILFCWECGRMNARTIKYCVRRTTIVGAVPNEGIRVIQKTPSPVKTS